MTLSSKAAAPWLKVASLLIAGLIMAGCGSLGFKTAAPVAPQAPSAAGAPTNSQAVAETPLRNGERIKVDFGGNANSPSSHEEDIKDDGTITLDYIGPMKAAGKAPRELEKEIRAKYVPDYFAQLTVTVTSSMRFYFVGGEVKAPDRHQYIGPTTVIRAIQASGDFTTFASKSKVLLIRADGKREVVDCEKALQDPLRDPPVYPGDSIVVKRRLF